MIIQRDISYFDSLEIARGKARKCASCDKVVATTTFELAMALPNCKSGFLICRSMRPAKSFQDSAMVPVSSLRQTGKYIGKYSRKPAPPRPCESLPNRPAGCAAIICVICSRCRYRPREGRRPGAVTDYTDLQDLWLMTITEKHISNQTRTSLSFLWPQSRCCALHFLRRVTFGICAGETFTRETLKALLWAGSNRRTCGRLKNGISTMPATKPPICAT